MYKIISYDDLLMSINCPYFILFLFVGIVQWTHPVQQLDRTGSELAGVLRIVTG